MRLSTFHRVVFDQTDKYLIYEYHAATEQGPVKLLKVIDENKALKHAFDVVYNVSTGEVGMSDMSADLPDYHMSVIMDILRLNAIQVAMRTQISDESDVLILGPDNLAVYLYDAWQKEDMESLSKMISSTILSPDALELLKRALKARKYDSLLDFINTKVEFA